MREKQAVFWKRYTFFTLRAPLLLSSRLLLVHIFLVLHYNITMMSKKVIKPLRRSKRQLVARKRKNRMKIMSFSLKTQIKIHSNNIQINSHAIKTATLVQCIFKKRRKKRQTLFTASRSRHKSWNSQRKIVFFRLFLCIFCNIHFLTISIWFHYVLSNMVNVFDSKKNF